MEREKKNIVWAIVIMLISIIVVGGLGAVFVQLGNAWFDGLTKPSEWIPNWVIPTIWTIIYLTFAIILFLWIKQENLPRKVTILLILNGIFNILWCLVFFTLKQLLLGNIVLIFNLILAVKFILEIYKTKMLYSSILLIYPVWLCLASSLNMAVWILN